MINMSHHPIRITAGKIINLSFSSFGNVSTIRYYLEVEGHVQKYLRALLYRS